MISVLLENVDAIEGLIFDRCLVYIYLFMNFL